MLVERRAHSHLRPPTHAPLDHASLPFDGFLPPWHHAHIAHAGAVLLVDRHECLHPVVASPLLEVPSAENPAADCPLANHLHASPGRSWRRHQCRLLRPCSGHAARQHLHLDESSGQQIHSPMRVSATIFSDNRLQFASPGGRATFTPRERGTDLGQGPNLRKGSARAFCVPRSPEHEK